VLEFEPGVHAVLVKLVSAWEDSDDVIIGVELQTDGTALGLLRALGSFV
jgi:hypothetical protein